MAVVVNASPCCFNPRKELVPTVQKAGWALGSVWMGMEKLTPTGVQTPECPAHSMSVNQLHYTSIQLIIYKPCENSEDLVKTK